MENKICGTCACPVEYEAVGCALVERHNQDEGAHAPALRAHDQNPQAHAPAFQRHGEDEAAHQELFARKADKVQLEAHAGNQDIHVTTTDKLRWDGKADAAQLQAHVGNQDIHVSSADKQRWDGKADAAELLAHTGNRDIHVTATDKRNWDAKADAALLKDYAAQFEDFKRLSDPSSLNLYLSPTGVDAPDRGSKGQPLRSIAYALEYFSNNSNMVNLVLGPGTYGDGTTLIITNKGFISIRGQNSNRNNYVINGGIECQFSRFFSLGGVTIVKPADAIGIRLYNVTGDIGSCTIEGGGNGIGIQIAFGHARVNGCTINNCNTALHVWLDSRMTAYSNLGTGNQHGIDAVGGLVLKGDTQPQAALPNSKSYGGQIFE